MEKYRQIPKMEKKKKMEKQFNRQSACQAYTKPWLDSIPSKPHKPAWAARARMKDTIYPVINCHNADSFP